MAALVKGRPPLLSLCFRVDLSDVLKAIARGAGPSKAMLALGYAGWAPGQLEHEIQANGWLHCEADDDLLFGEDLDAKYDQALAKLGVDISFLSGDAGHA